MKTILALLFSFVVQLGFAQLSVESLRKDYYKASNDSAVCQKLYNKVINDKSTDNTVLCYKGAIDAAMAGHLRNKSEKIKTFNEGKKLIETAIAADKENVELRFLRFTIQTNCPKALGYNEQITSDKQFILQHLDSVTNDGLKKKMANFLLASKHLTAAEKSQLSKI